MNLTIPNFDTWLLAQCHREEGTGILARCWFENQMADRSLNFNLWLTEREAGGILKVEILAAKAEYKNDCESLRAGKHATFYSSLFVRENPELSSAKQDWHSQHPEISADQHLRFKHLLLLRQLETKLLVYLDKCHWIGLRHVVLKTKFARKEYEMLLRLLRELKDAQLILCPTSFPLFTELMKQSDDQTRLATAYLMDELGDGICLPAGPVIQENEVRQHILKSWFGSGGPDAKEWLWTKACWILGALIPHNPAFSPEENTWIQKSFIDHVWESRLGDLVERLDQNRWQGMDYPLFASAHNLDGVFYRKRQFIFKDILIHEKGKLLMDLAQGALPKVAAELAKEYPDKVTGTLNNSEKLQAPDPWIVPSMQIVAGIRASFFSAGQWLKANDLVDAEHASVALPYCDVFACDKPLAHHLRGKALKYDEIYQTKVVATASDLIQALKEKTSHPPS